MSCFAYEAPAHENWNLAHICSLMPESHTLFITPAGCSRIIRLSALEKGINENFTTLEITEKDIINGGVEEKTISGALRLLDLLKEENRLPKALMIFVSCVDTFIGTDRDYCLSELKEAYPDIYFIDCAMDPINREILPPIVRMHEKLSVPFKKCDAGRSVCFTGSFIPPREDNELVAHLAANGIGTKHIGLCKSISEVESMGGCMLNIVTHPSGVYAAKKLKERTGLDWVLMPSLGCADKTVTTYREICRRLGIPEPDMKKIRSDAENAITSFAMKTGAAALSEICPTPYTLALYLKRLGLDLRLLFADKPSEAEAEAYNELKKQLEILHPDESFSSAYKDERFADESVTAIGAEAAYYLKTRHYVSRIAFGGDFGFNSLVLLAEDAFKASSEERPLEEITVTGRGCLAL